MLVAPPAVTGFTVENIPGDCYRFKGHWNAIPCDQKNADIIEYIIEAVPEVGARCPYLLMVDQLLTTVISFVGYTVYRGSIISIFTKFCGFTF